MEQAGLLRSTANKIGVVFRKELWFFDIYARMINTYANSIIGNYASLVISYCSPGWTRPGGARRDSSALCGDSYARPDRYVRGIWVDGLLGITIKNIRGWRHIPRCVGHQMHLELVISLALDPPWNKAERPGTPSPPVTLSLCHSGDVKVLPLFDDESIVACLAWIPSGVALVILLLQRTTVVPASDYLWLMTAQ